MTESDPEQDIGNASLLFSKLSKIVGEIDRIPESGFNSYGDYSYATERDFVECVRGKLAVHGIFISTSVVKHDRERIKTSNTNGESKMKFLTTVTTLHTFIDWETGEKHKVTSMGESMDSGDKGLPQAITGAIKSMLMKNFLISTGDKRNSQTTSPSEPRAAKVTANPHFDAIKKIQEAMKIHDCPPSLLRTLLETMTEGKVSSLSSASTEEIIQATKLIEDMSR